MYDRDFFEEYALLNLISCYDERLVVMLPVAQKWESPDFQSEVLDLGIEVTRAINPVQGECGYLIREYLGQGLSEDIINCKIKERLLTLQAIKGEELTFDHIASHCNIPVVADDYDIDQCLSQIARSIHEKTHKLNRNYRIFSANWLYIFTEYAPLDRSDIETVVSQVTKHKMYNYDNIFVDCFEDIFLIDKGGLVHLLSVDAETLRLWKLRMQDKEKSMGKKYVNEKGNEVFVSSGISGGKSWMSVYRKKGCAGTHRIKAAAVPIRDTEAEAQEDLDAYAIFRHWPEV